MCTQVPSIPSQAGCGSNNPGVKTVSVIDQSQIVFPLPAVDVDTKTISTDISIVASGNDFASWTFLKKDAKHTETENGDSHDTLLELHFSKDDDTKRYAFDKMDNPCCRYLVIYTDENDVQKIITDLEFGWDYSTGAGESSELNKYIGRFTKTGNTATLYEGIIPVAA